MTIRNIDLFLAERGLIKELSLAHLRETRLGIDAQAYIDSLLSAGDTKEPLVTALGGAPLALGTRIEDNLRAFEGYKVKPVFVFPGIEPCRKDKAATLYSEENNVRSVRRHQAWENYEKGKTDLATMGFASSSSTTHKDVLRLVHRFFRHRRVEFMTAPYLAAAQLIYLERHPKQYIHAIYGSTEALLFEHVDRVILSINWATSTFTFVSKRDLLAELNLSSEQFLDLGLLAGFDHCPTLPVFPSQDSFSFRSALGVMLQFRSGAAAVMQYAESNPLVRSSNYPDHFARAKCLIKQSLVMIADRGQVLPLPVALSTTTTPKDQPPTINLNDAPSDIHEVFSYRLPDLIFFQQWRGLTSGNILDVLTSGYWVDETPLCGGVTEDYKRFLKETLTDHPQGPRTMALGLISSALNDFWRNKPLSAVFYFDSSPPGTNVIQHGSAPTNSLLRTIKEWNVAMPFIEEELRRQNSNTIDLTLCLGATALPKLAQRTKSPKNPQRLLEKKDEVVANTLWRFLELRFFLNSSHQHTPHAKAMFTALKEAGRVNDKFQEPLYLALELIRANVLHAGRYGGKVLSGGPNIGSEADRQSMLLVLRVVSIVPLNFNTIQWTGPVSRELLVFNSFLRALTRSLRALVESTAMNMFLVGDAKREREDYLEISLMLPFQTDTSTVMGIVVKGYCDAVWHMSQNYEGGMTGPQGDYVKTAAVDMMEQPFGASIKNVKAELERGFRFWDVVYRSVAILYEEGAMAKDLFKQFQQAQDWLQAFRPSS